MSVTLHVVYIGSGDQRYTPAVGESNTGMSKLDQTNLLFESDYKILTLMEPKEPNCTMLTYNYSLVYTACLKGSPVKYQAPPPPPNTSRFNISSQYFVETDNNSIVGRLFLYAFATVVCNANRTKKYELLLLLLL